MSEAWAALGGGVFGIALVALCLGLGVWLGSRKGRQP